MSKPVIVLDSNQNEIEQLTRKWKKVKNIGDGILSFGSAGFVGSVLSPFDFEGPVVEIVTAVVAVAGFIVRKIGENHLADIQGTDVTWSDEDKAELNRIKKTIDNSREERKEKQLKKSA